MDEDDRPWGELSRAEQDALMAEAGEGSPTEVAVIRIPPELWAHWQDAGDHAEEDTYTEGGGS